MGIRSEPSSTSLSNEGATRAICQDGKWYKPVTVEYAFSVRMDVPLFFWQYDKVRPDHYPPATYRHLYEVDTRLNHQSPFVYLHPAWERSSWYVEVDPVKEEYVCE